MRKNISPFYLLLFSILFITSYHAYAQINPSNYTLEQKIGQMIVIGVTDKQIDSSSRVYKDIKENKVGGIVLFEKNINPVNSKENFKKLIADIQSLSEIPLFTGIDQEGGLVNRLKEKYGFPKMQSAAYIGKLNNPDSTKFYADRTASELASLGINLNFAPVVDLASNPDNPIIAKVKRSYSKSPKKVTKYALQVIRSHHAFGIRTCLKHFPGHGSSTSDSHLGIVDVSRTWKKKELKPYKKIIASGNCDAVMTAHIVNARLDKDSLPATLSKKIITGILREQLHFNGVVFSDDMQMHAIAKYYGLENAIRLSILAGVDVLMFSNNIKGSSERTSAEVQKIIQKLVINKEVSEERINQSFQRIMALKMKKY